MKSVGVMDWSSKEDTKYSMRCREYSKFVSKDIS